MPSIRLNWAAPTTRSDGSTIDPANDLSGYVIHYYLEQVQNIQAPIEIDGGETLEHTIENLPFGVMGFRVAAVSASGTRGNFTAWSNVDESEPPANAPGGFLVTVL